MENQADRRQHHAAHEQHEICVAHDVLRGLAAAASACNRAQRCAACAEQVGERRNERHHRKAQSQSRERGSSLAGDFADVNPVYDIIKQVEHLRDKHGSGKRKRFAPHAPFREVNLPGRLFRSQGRSSFPTVLPVFFSLYTNIIQPVDKVNFSIIQSFARDAHELGQHRTIKAAALCGNFTP